MFSDITGQWLLLLILKAPGSYLAKETTYRLRLLVIITLPLNAILLRNLSLICYTSQWVNSCGCYGRCGSASHFATLSPEVGETDWNCQWFLCPRKAHGYLLKTGLYNYVPHLFQFIVRNNCEDCCLLKCCQLFTDVSESGLIAVRILII